MVKISKCRH